ncbi:hypothetical protein GALL_515970 [mine drainage metagenome]|uniref:DUF3079 domain-containing protein n=1 Tax=mine drainage metagenome TaxID=410659 RepID=A0A1J5PG89_9ZZZZ
MSQKKFPIHPANPERLCWGCDKYCAANDMMCGNGSDRTQHPYELFGEDWQSWGDEGSCDLSPPRVGPSTGGCANASAAEITTELTQGLRPQLR